MRYLAIGSAVAVTLLVSPPAPVNAATLTLAWDPSPTAISYVVLFGSAPRAYTGQIAVPGTATRLPVGGLADGATYYFAVKAIDAAGRESVLSEEISGRTPSIPVPASLGFAANGTGSLIWQHENGSLASWFLSGVIVTGDSPLNPPAVLDANWKIVGSADFNLDGFPDIVFQHAITGTLFLWEMSGTNLSRPASFSPAGPIDANWKVVAIADFNMDGRPDLLFQHRHNGILVIWYLNQTTVTSSTVANPSGPSDPQWRVVAATDLNGDTRADLLLQHAVTGTLFLWYLNGANLIGAASTSPTGPNDPNWRVVSVSDMNGDGWQDFVLEHSVSGQVLVWYMSKATVASGSLFVPSGRGDARWNVVTIG